MPIESRQISDVSTKGLEIYESKLKDILEPDHNNDWVAIHVDSGDYAVARHRGDAVREIQSRHGIDGRLLATKIGPEPDFALASRLFSAGGSKTQ